MLFAAHAKNVTVPIAHICMNVDTVKFIFAVHVVLPQSALDLNVMTRIISVSAVVAIAKDVRDCVVQIASFNMNVISVMSLVVGSAPRITNARLVTLDTVMNALPASMKCTHVEIVAENNALVAVYVVLIQPKIAALGAST